MNHLDILGSHNKFNYIFHDYHDSKSGTSYEYMNEKIKNLGYMITPDWSPDKSILLENNEEVIAGIFLNTTKYNKTLLILVAYVEEEFRRQGIYSQLHKFVDMYGLSAGKESVYTYIHCDNTLMTDVVSKKIGYKPVMNLMKRSILAKT